MATARIPPPPARAAGGANAAMVSPPYGAAPPPQPMAAGQPHGTLAPGTRIMVGPIVVTVQRYLSQGGFAHVYLVTTDKPIPMPVSASSTPGAPTKTTRDETLHVLKRMAVPDKEALASVRNEVEVHKKLRSHPNIVHFIEASATALRGGGYEIFILMEYCSGGGIIDLMNARLRTRLSEPEVLKIFGDVAAGLSVMHSMSPPLMHRDLKVENILLAPPPRSDPRIGPTYKLCDFGSTKAITSRRAAQTLDEVKMVEADLNKCTTLQYRAPEMVDVYQRRIIDEKADIWAMGVLLYKLCYYTTPFEENGGGPLAILNANYRFPSMPPYSQRLKDLIGIMLQEQSSNRPSIDEILLRVHHMLGTKAPASVLDKIEKAKAISNNPSSASTSSTYGRSGGQGTVSDLIQSAPSQAQQQRIEEEEARKRSEGITPMRRGRPAKGAATSSVAAKFEQSAASSLAGKSPSPAPANHRATVLGPLGQSQRAAQNPLSPPLRADPAAKTGLGFSDSFAPLPSASPSGSAPTREPEQPSRPSSVLDHSPSLPGFEPDSRTQSARASPLPPSVTSPPPPPATEIDSRLPQRRSETQSEKDSETSDRFPSVEELDRRYPTSRPLSSALTSSAATKSTSTSSSNGFGASQIPGLSSRPSVSAMTDKFGAIATSKRASVPVQSRSLPPPASKPVGNGVGQRWPHSNASRPLGVADKTSPSSRQSPSLPSRKHDWLSGKERPETKLSKDTLSGQETKEDDSSDDELTVPEDPDKPIDKRASRMGMSLANGQERNVTYKSNPVQSPTESSAPRSLDRDVQPASKGLDSALQHKSGSSDTAAGFDADLLTSHSSAKAPAWDEDDEEMHFIPQPTLGATQFGSPSQDENAATVGRLIDFDNGNENAGKNADRSAISSVSAPATTKKYANASTSPGPHESSEGCRQGTSGLSLVAEKKNKPAPPPVLSPKPQRTASQKDVNKLVNQLENVPVSGGSTGKPLPPAKPSNIRVRSQESKADEPTVTQRSVDAQPGRRLPSPSRQPPLKVGMDRPAVARTKVANSASQSPSDHAKPLKPWEREAMEKEQVEKFGSLRSRADGKDAVTAGDEGAAEVTDEQGTRIPVKGEAQDRFRGVSSLISQWQNNATRGAPGWGTVGSSLTLSNGSEKKDEDDIEQTSKDEDTVSTIHRSSTLGPRTGSHFMQNRLPSREV